MNDIKSKILSLALTIDINLTDRAKNEKSLSNLNKSNKNNKSKLNTKLFISPKNNAQKRAKTDILGNQSDIFILRHQNENKSINRKILKNINNKFNVNRKKIDNKSIKHISTNSQNLTGIKMISKVTPLALKEIMKKKIGVFSLNFTERTSRNHSIKRIIKHNTTSKKNYLDSFSPRIGQEIIYKKMKKIYNKKSALINSFLKNVSSNEKIKVLIRKNNKSNNNSKKMSIATNNELFNKSVKGC